MIKKLITIIVLFVVIIGGLQLFGGRDFSQMSLVLEKQNTEGDLSLFISDVMTIFKGDTVNQPDYLVGKFAKQVMYRWKDEWGVVHMSEQQPDVADYEIMKIKDFKFNTEKAKDDKD